MLPYQLSSGEKQILIILLTVLVEDNQPYVLFMDEPEVSLHLEWQKRLVDLCLELNPNVQTPMLGTQLRTQGCLHMNQECCDRVKFTRALLESKDLSMWFFFPCEIGRAHV